MKKAKNSLQRIFLMLLLAAVAVPLVFGTAAAFADEGPDPEPVPVFEAEDYNYSINSDGTATLVEYTGDSDMIEVPLEIDGHPVSAVGYQAFTYKNMKSLSIPEGIKTIEGRAFEYCDITDSFLLPRDIEIRQDAFAYAVLPEVITIPEGARIGSDAFAYCEKMKVLIIESRVDVSKQAFNYSKDLKTVVCASDVKLGERAFEYCKQLKQVYLCGDVEVGENAFSYSDDPAIINAGEDEFADLIVSATSPDVDKPETGSDDLTEYTVGNMTFNVPSGLQESKEPGYNLWLVDETESPWFLGAAAFPPAGLDFDDEETIQIMTATAENFVDVDYVDRVTVCGWPGVWMDIRTKENSASGVYLYISADTSLYHMVFLDFGENRMKFTDIVNSIVIE